MPSSCTLLSVSHDAVTQENISRCLRDAHLLQIELYQADTYIDALQKLEQHVGIDLIFLDTSLPDMEGNRMLQSIIQKFPEVSVIVIPRDKKPHRVQQYLRMGAVDFLYKDLLSSFVLEKCVRQVLLVRQQRKETQHFYGELEKMKSRFREAQKMAKLGSWEMDMVSNSMLWSQELHDIFGFPPSNIERSFSEFLNYVHRDDRRKLQETIQQVERDGRVRTINFRIVVGGTRIKQLHSQIKAHVDQVTQRLQLFGVVQDVSHQYTEEQVLTPEDTSNNQFSKAQREMFKELSFHVRTPLSSVVNLSYLLGQQPDQEAVQEYISSLQTSVEDLSRTLNNLFNFTFLILDELRIESQDFELRPFLDHLIKNIELKAAKKDVVLSISYPDTLLDVVHGDHNKINQILYNVLSYAVRRSPRNASVHLKIEMEQKRKDHYKLKFIVTDKGTYIPLSQVRKIKKGDSSYHLRKSSKDNHALDLPIAARLTSNLGGNFQIKSTEEAEETQFTIQLFVKPVLQQTQKAPQASEPSRPLRILLVEDHFLNQIATRKVLTTWSNFVQVEEANNGFIAVQKFEREHYDVILMDLQMPVMDGFEATDLIRQKSNVPIIALTANSSAEEAKKCETIGMNAYLSKPFKPKELHAKIMEFI